MLRKTAPLQICRVFTRNKHFNYCRKPLVVTVIGSCLQTGRYAALLLKQNPLIRELRLHCIQESVCGLAMELAQIDSNTRIKAYIGPALLKEALIDTKVVVVVGHCQRKPGESEEQLFARNAPHVRNAAIYTSEFAKDAIFCIACQPVNALVPMVAEEFKKAQEFNPKKVIGIANLWTIRVNSIIACYTDQDACRVTCPVIGGCCPYSCVAVLSQARPCSDFPMRLAKNIQAKLARTDDDVLELKKQEKDVGSFSLSYAFAISRFITHLTQAMSCKEITEYAFVKQDGAVESFLPYMLSIVKLGINGIESVHMPKLNSIECELLQNAAIAVENSINLGSSYVTGEKSRKPKREPTLPSYCKQEKQDTSTHAFDVIDKIPFAGKLCPSDEIKQSSS